MNDDDHGERPHVSTGEQAEADSGVRCEPEQTERSHVHDEMHPHGDVAVGAAHADHSIRFGLKSLATLTLIAALVFALISFAGAFYGLLISLAIAVGALLLIFFGGVITYPGLKPMHRRLLNTWLIVCCLLSVGFFVGVTFAGGGKAAAHFFNEVAIKKKFTSELGFSYETDSNFIGDQLVPTLRITAVAPGGEFERAGFLVDDVIIDYQTQEFFRELAQRQGQELTVEVATAGQSFQATQLDKLPRRAVTFKVP